jgi:hypothetical protein
LTGQKVPDKPNQWFRAQSFCFSGQLAAATESVVERLMCRGDADTTELVVAFIQRPFMTFSGYSNKTTDVRFGVNSSHRRFRDLK